MEKKNTFCKRLSINLNAFYNNNVKRNRRNDVLSCDDAAAGPNLITSIDRREV